MIAQGDTSTLWVGGINPSSSGPQVTGLRPVTGTDVTVRDAGWSDGSTLVYVGTSTNGRLGVWTVLVDGSNAAALGTSNLPGGDPTSIAVMPGAFPVVAVGEPPSAELHCGGRPPTAAAAGRRLRGPPARRVPRRRFATA